MRIRNGLKINDYVMYHEKVYLVTKLYEEKDGKFCDLISKDTNEVLTKIPIFHCIRINT